MKRAGANRLRHLFEPGQTASLVRGAVGVIVLVTVAVLTAIGETPPASLAAAVPAVILFYFGPRARNGDSGGS